MPLRCAIEATTTVADRPTGISRYARCLIEALDALEPADPELELVLLYRSSRYGRRARLPTGRRIRHQMWRSVIWPLRKPYDVVHATDHRLPPWSGPARLATIHDVYAALGINHDDPAGRARQVDALEKLAARCDRLIFVSDSTKRDFLQLFRYPEDRTHVIHLGVGANFRPQDPGAVAAVRRRYGIAGPYLFFVGLHYANKNLARLLEAFAQAGLARDLTLVLAGPAPDDVQARALAQRIDELRLRQRVQLIGYVAEPDVPALYAGAAAFLFPSLYEGFGLPILEAMACGTPVLTSTTSSCPEVAGGHAVLVDPRSVDAIAAGIAKAVGMDAAQREAARLHAVGKTWRQAAAETLKVYQRAATERQ